MTAAWDGQYGTYLCDGVLHLCTYQDNGLQSVSGLPCRFVWSDNVSLQIYCCFCNAWSHLHARIDLQQQ